jgi:hypothetical protein
VCPRILEVKGLLPSWWPVIVEFSVPEGYTVRSGLDWRGFGWLGGPYLIPYWLAYYYLADGIVVAKLGVYQVIDSPVDQVSTVYQLGTGKDVVTASTQILVEVRSYLGSSIGFSPRSPTVLVLVVDDHPLMIPGTAHTAGSVVYVKLGLASPPEALVAHETAHGWFNYGLLHGDFAVTEGVATALVLSALGSREEMLLDLLDPSYRAWTGIAMRLREAGLRVCGTDVLLDALSRLFAEALRHHGVEVNFSELARLMVELAPASCRCRLATVVGWVLVGNVTGCDVG